MLSTEPESCPDCGHNQFYINTHIGEITCKKCSLVVDDSMIDTNDQIYSEEPNRTINFRSGAPPDERIVDNLRTNVGMKGDITKLRSTDKRKMHKLNRMNLWTSGSLHNTMKYAFDSLALFSSKLSLPVFVEKETANIFRQCVMKGFTRKRSIDSVLTASLYVATRIHKIPKPIKEIAYVCRVETSSFMKVSKDITKELNIKTKLMDAVDYIPRFASELGLSTKVQTRAIQLLETARKEKLIIGLSPLSCAGTFLYMAALELKERKQQYLFARVAGITEATLRAKHKKFVHQLGLKHILLKK